MKNNFALIKSSGKEIIPILPFYKSGQSYKKEETTSQESKINPAKLIHGTIDFKADGMKLGFNLVVESPQGPISQTLHIISDGDSFRLQIGGDSIFINKTLYFVEETSIAPMVDDHWKWENIQDFISNPKCNGDLYQIIKHVLRSYLEFPTEAHYGLVSVWVIATYFAHLFPAFPFLLFLGPKETGKSKTLETLDLLNFNSVKVKTVTEAALCDTTDGLKGTVVFDQAEKLPIKMVGFLADSYKRAGAKRRIIAQKNGKRVVRVFSGYGPKAFGSTSSLNPDLADRCCQINMQRTMRSLPDLLGEEPGWAMIRDLLYRFVLLKWKEVRDVYNSIPSAGTRKGELWRPLFTILKILNVPDKEIKDIMNTFAKGTEKTEDRLSSAEEALFRVLLERAEENEIFEMKPADILQAMESFLDKNEQQTSQWVGRTISLFNLSVERKKRTRQKIVHYVFESQSVKDIAKRYL